MQDLFDKFHMTEFTEFPFLPEELRNIDLEPDDLPTIDLEAEKLYNYITIKYDKGEAPKICEMVGYNFLRAKKNTFYFKELVEKQNPVQNVWINEEPDYILVLYLPEQIDAVVEMFNLPSISKNASFNLKELNHVGRLV